MSNCSFCFYKSKINMLQSFAQNCLTWFELIMYTLNTHQMLMKSVGVVISSHWYALCLDGRQVCFFWSILVLQRCVINNIAKKDIAWCSSLIAQLLFVSIYVFLIITMAICHKLCAHPPVTWHVHLVHYYCI